MWSSARRASRAALALTVIGASAGAVSCEKSSGGVVQIAAGGDFTCALTKGGEVYCWGDEQRIVGGRALSQLPRPTRTVPEKVASVADASFIDVASGWGCAVLKSGKLSCFWEDGLKQMELPPIDGAVRVSLARLHAVIEKTDGTALSFIRPGKGDATPKPIGGLVGAKRVLTGDLHGCALMTDGTVKCWGAPSTGAADDAEPSENNAPRTLRSLAGVTTLSVGRGFNCAVNPAKAVLCWGENSFAQVGQPGVGLGGPPVGKPTKVPFVSRATSVDAGVYHACAVLEGGSVTCWGSDEYGQSGHVQNGVAVAGLKDVVEVTLGEYHTCALDKTGHVKCWGRNPRGSLGNGSTVDSAVPVDVKFTR